VKHSFQSIDGYPDSVSAENIVVRLIQGIGFRFYWATEGLREHDYEFDGGGLNSIAAMMQHILRLLRWVRSEILPEALAGADEGSTVRDNVFAELQMLQKGFAGMSARELQGLRIEGLPFWHIINGPMADALTHIGQINVLRRIAGNPAPAANPFTGRGRENA
jgi:hypothetical protein